MKLKFTRRAVNDLKRLREFIAEHNPDAASRISRKLKQNIQYLVDNPKLGKPVDDFQDMRDFITGPYIARYVLIGDTIIILKIWHGKENQ